MAKRSTGERTTGFDTRERMVEAAIATLKEVGFAGASARQIARTGGFNPALIFYHFGSVNDLLLAALDATSEVRMKRYRDAVEGCADLPSLLQVAVGVYREDLESGHITVLAEMMAGASAVPELGPEIVARMHPWVQLTEDSLSRVLAGTPFEQLAPTRDLAFGIVALYLGMELITHLDGDRQRVESLFGVATNIASLVGGLLGAPGGEA